MKSKYLTTIKARSKAVDKSIHDSINDRLILIVPDNLDKKDLLRLKPDGIKVDVWIDNCMWLVGQVYRRMLYVISVDSEIEFIPMSSRVMRSVIPNYALYLKILIDNGILESNNSYSNLYHYSKGYRLKEAYQNSAPSAYTISNKRIAQKIRKQYSIHLQEVAAANEEISHLLYWLTRPELVLDKTNALEAVSLYYQSMKEYIISQKDASDGARALKALDSGVAITKHKIKNWNPANFNFDEEGGRLYTEIVSLDSYLRCFLSFDGKPLVSIDIMNSQPFHMLFLLQMLNSTELPSTHPTYAVPHLGSKITNSISTTSNQIKHTSQHITTSHLSYMCPKISHSIDYEYIMTPTYQELVLDGVLYEYLSDVMYGSDIQDAKLRFKTRSLTKYELLRMFYFDPKKRYSISKEVYGLFKGFFRDVAGLIDYLKEPDYRRFPLILQKLESEMLLKRVASAIFKRNPNIPLFTIHDSILTTEEHLGEVKSIVLEEYRKALGHTPQLKETKLDPGNYMEFISKQVSKKSQKYARKYKLNPKELETVGACENENFALAYMVKRAIKLYIDNPAQGSTPTMQYLYQGKNLKPLSASKEDKSSIFIIYFKPLESFDDYHIHQCERFLTIIPQASSFLWSTPLQNQLWMRNAS